MKPFVVFMCSSCGRFTNAPLGQKHRRCSYCGKIIDIRKAATAVFDRQDDAIVAVKEFNAGKSEEFKMAVERSKAKLEALMPKERLDGSDFETDGNETSVPAGKTARLMTLLEREAGTQPCNLDRLRELCEQYGLDWDWVEGNLTKMASAGEVLFPRPWLVRLVTHPSAGKEETVTKATDVTKEILTMIREAGGTVSVQEVITHFAQKGVSVADVESSLNRLMQSGTVYEPRTGTVSLL
ncbi:MAG: DUF1922 domain-containing protein [Candidatus Thorarchaeota archaeon]|nr:DUF1922 domain-containing protein [Candidatus Thorarchaeota archaeon]